jgi:hypothetical protein
MWIIGRMALTGENRIAGRKSFPSATWYITDVTWLETGAPLREAVD